MRHRIAGKKLNRTRKQRKALFKSLISSFIRQGQIETTETKAKAVKPLIDKLVSKARQSSLSAHRQVHAFLQDKEATKKLVQILAPSFKRGSGFTKMVRTIIRRGDAAQMVKLEWVEEEDKSEAPSTKSETNQNDQNSKSKTTKEPKATKPKTKK